jgi:hypothetical protein
MAYIEIFVDGTGSARAEIDDRYPRTAAEIIGRLPLEARAPALGGRRSTSLFLSALLTRTRLRSSEAGDVSFWTPGSAFCIFIAGPSLIRRSTTSGGSSPASMYFPASRRGTGSSSGRGRLEAEAQPTPPVGLLHDQRKINSEGGGYIPSSSEQDDLTRMILAGS